MSTPTAESLEAERRSAVFVAERPWGQFQQFVLNQVCTVKVITVEPGHRLSLQKHGERDEMWQVLDVPLDVQVGEKSWTAQVGEIVYTPKGSLHRLGN
ncbi:MAG: cupin domain-containing protein, partial [Quadrisphaera sp.]